MVEKDGGYHAPPPLQGVTWGDTGKYPLDHALQHCRGRVHAPLGERGGRRGGRTRGPQEVNTAPGSVLLHQRRPDQVNTG